MKRFNIALATVILCAVLGVQTSAFAENTPGWVGTDDREVNRAGITNYVSTDGTFSASVAEDGITWIGYENAGTLTWYGVDNEKGIFEPGSRLWLRCVTENDDPAQYSALCSEMDSETRASIKEGSSLIELGAESPEGVEYRVLPDTVPLYIQLSKSIDKNDIASVILRVDSDEAVNMVFMNMQFPEGRGEFIGISMTHFGDPLILGEKAPFSASVVSEYEPAILCVGALVIALAVVVLVVQSRRRKSEN